MNQTITANDYPHDDQTETAAYIQRLDLGADPFAADFSSDYFYSGGMRLTILEQVLHYARFSDQVVLVTGSTGSGTSTVMSELLNQLQPIMDCCQLNAEFMTAPEHILYPLAQHLGLPWSEPVQVADFLAELQVRARLQHEPDPLLLVVDQAQYLALESLEILHFLYSGAGGAIRLVLVGEYQIEQLVRLAGFAAEQLRILELEPLTQSETSEYLLGRLRAAGYAGADPLSADQLVVLHQQSGGNLAEINRLAPRLLLVDTEAKGRGFSLRIPIAHIVAITILTVALVLSYLYRGANDETTETVVVLPQSGSTDADWRSGSANTPARIDRAPAEKPEQQQSAPEQNAVPEIQLMSEVTPPPPATTEQVKPARPAAVATAPAKAPAAAPTVVSKPPPVVKAPAPAAKPLPPKPTPKPTASTFTAAEQRLLQHAAGDYMLQLMGSVTEQRVKQFVQQYAGRIAVSYFETTLQGKPWFVAVSGPYPGRAEAVVAIGKLPQALQQEKPWARNVASIQQDIRNRQ